MDNKTLFMALGWILLLYTWYSLFNLQGKIHCQFHTKERTIEDRIIKVKDKVVRFKSGTYQVNPKRFSIRWKKLWSILPFPILFLEYKWDTDQPIDPATFKNTWDSPEARNAANSENDWRGFNKGVESGGNKKQGMLEKWLPWITLAVVVIVIFFVYQMNGKMGIIEQQIQNLGGMIPKVK